MKDPKQKPVVDEAMLRQFAHGQLDEATEDKIVACLLYTSPSPRDGLLSRMPSSA